MLPENFNSCDTSGESLLCFGTLLPKNLFRKFQNQLFFYRMLFPCAFRRKYHNKSGKFLLQMILGKMVKSYLVSFPIDSMLYKHMQVIPERYQLKIPILVNAEVTLST